MKRIKFLIVFLLSCMIMACSFQVKNTDGLRAAYEKIELAYPLAAEIADRKDLNEKDRQTLIDSYNEAKAAVNSFLKDVKTKSVKVVDVPLTAFEKDRAKEKIEKFINEAKAAREKTRAIGPEVIVAIAVPVIETIWKLNQESEKEAYERFTKIIDENLMVDFVNVPKKIQESKK